MKKVIGVLLLFIGLALLSLNYKTLHNTSELSHAMNRHKQKKPIEIKGYKNQGLDLSKVNLPTIFDALLHSL